jgi:hypothetical protein
MYCPPSKKAWRVSPKVCVYFGFSICFKNYLPTYCASYKLLAMRNKQFWMANTMKRNNECFYFHGLLYCIRDLNNRGCLLQSHVPSQTDDWSHGHLRFHGRHYIIHNPGIMWVMLRLQTACVFYESVFIENIHFVSGFSVIVSFSPTHCDVFYFGISWNRLPVLPQEWIK